MAELKLGPPKGEHDQVRIKAVTVGDYTEPESHHSSSDRIRDYRGPDCATLQISAPFHGFHHGDFVGVFQVGAHGNPDADASNADPERLEEFREVHSRSLPLGVGVRGDNNFLDCAALEAFNQTLQVQLIGADAS